MNKSELLYVAHIIDAIDAIEEFVKDCDFLRFTNDRMRYDATVRNLQTMAEATQKLSPDTKSYYPQIPWQNISGFRNILVHDYLEGVDSEIIWSVIFKELPVLKSCMLLARERISNKHNVYESYERIADWFDKHRSRDLFEKPYLEMVVSYLKSGAKVLDLGCGMGEPIAQYFIEQGFDVTGIDGSTKLIELSKLRFPKSKFIVADMRDFLLPEKFDLVIAWHSLFHLTKEEQRKMFQTFALLTNESGLVLFTSDANEGEIWTNNGGENLYHASLSIDEYKSLLVNNGFQIIINKVADKNCGDATVWVARKEKIY
ncbi:DUF86 domain-containing SAM-dependent methyltransferase [Candidatus Megaera polyxenophila]|nr:DUF86 domain-containing SAM-dependent methyltransferase [Candidatus Megaera polyxenophila]